MLAKIHPRKYTPLLLAVLLALLTLGLAARANPAAHEGEHAARGADATEPAAEPQIAVPANPGWITGPLLGIMWVFIAAIVLGPVVMFFRPAPEPEAAPHHDDGHGAGHDAAGHDAAGHEEEHAAVH